jgi:Spirocyclase AveC-like
MLTASRPASSIASGRNEVMTVELTQPAPGITQASGRRRWRTVSIAVVAVVGVAAVIVIAVEARPVAVADRIANPDVRGAPRPVEPLWGKSNWLTLHQVGTIVMMIVLVTVVVLAWRRHPRHPILLMVIATTVLVWQDPIMNWAPYAVYNPQLWHWPETWPLVSLSPTVEPFIVIGYATFYMAPFFPAIWFLRRTQARRPPESFVSRHPLVALGALILAIGFVFDACLEIFLVRTQLYIYSQVIPFGSIAAGKWHQFPLIWESALVTLVMIAAGVLLYRDDTGRTLAEKLALRIRAFRPHPALGTFLVMFAFVNVAYFAYGAGFAVIRASKAATSVACPWPYPEAKVYDPNGFYEQAGQPGPYFPGIWAAWPSGQLGRPDVNPPAGGGGRCGAGGG